MSEQDTDLGEHTDHYDAEEVLGQDAPDRSAPRVSRDAAVRAVREVVRQAQCARLAPLPCKVSAAHGDVGEVPLTEDDVLGAILSDESDTGAFSPETSLDYPVLQRLYRKFQSAMPAPKVVRVDTEETYAGWLDRKRAPYLAELAERVSALEQAHAVHTADGHGGLAVRQGDLDVLGEAAKYASDRAREIGTAVPLSLPPWAVGKVSCWQDGGEIYCSVRLPGPDGKARIATTATPAERHVEEVVRYMVDAQVEPVEVMGALPVLAQILGGGAMVTQLCRAAPQLLARPEVAAGCFVGTIEPCGDAATAAAMSLLQMSQGGDAAALSEAARLRATARGAVLLAHAQECLARARGGA